MKIVYLIFVLAVAILAVVFAAQNSLEVAITFFSWSASGSLSLVLIITLSIGIAIGLLIMAPSVFKRWFQSSGLKRRLHRLEKERRSEQPTEGTNREAQPSSPAPSAAPQGEDAPTAEGSADPRTGA